MGKIKKELSPVILIGGNHHNGLNLARSFGKNGIKPYGIIVSDTNKNLFSAKSKYWKKTFIAKNDAEAVKILEKEFSDKKKKPVIIPWSDGAAREIDLRFDHLKEKFILPSVGNKQGGIVERMDKSKQVEFAAKNGIPMAETFVIDLSEKKIPEKLTFPCFLKPVASYEGDKNDICKCENKEELEKALENFRDKKYFRILAQEFIDYDTEYTFSGSIGRELAYFETEKIRTWAGSGSFVRCSDDEKVHTVALKVLESLGSEGYSGLFDVDVFRKGDEIYFNEINWRSSGLDYMCMATGVHFAVIWYLSVIGEDTSDLKHFCNDTSVCAMDDATDLRNAVYGDLSKVKWFGDFRHSKSYAIMKMTDIKPVFSQYSHLFKEMIRRGDGDDGKK